MYPRPPTDEDVKRPAGLTFDNLPDIVTVTEVCDVTRLDKKTVLKAIHGGTLPAWFPAGSAKLGFRMHRGDVEAWFFSDPSRAFTPGVGGPKATP